jgi:hypothetical protein
VTETENLPNSAAVTGGVRILLRFEGLALFAGATSLYAFSFYGGPWWLYLALFLVPDLSFVGYLAGPRIGAWAYNALHSTILALGLLAVGLGLLPHLTLLALIWLAHIGFDRALGYGLKYSAGFGFTHLGRIGRGAAKV